MRSVTDRDFASQSHVDAPDLEGCELTQKSRTQIMNWNLHKKQDLTLGDGSITDQDSASQSHVDAHGMVVRGWELTVKGKIR